MSSKPVNLFVVEDDEVDVINIKRVFRDSDTVTAIEVARDGVEALSRLRADEIPRERLLILLDLNMPRMGGIEFLEELREDEELQRIPVVVLTTSSDAQDRADAYALHVAGYMVKPVTRDRFVECMEQLESYWSTVEFP